MIKNRLINQIYAWLVGFFWLPCPICGKYFGGHEIEQWGCASIPQKEGNNKCICGECAHNHPKQEKYLNDNNIPYRTWVRIDRFSSPND